MNMTRRRLLVAASAPALLLGARSKSIRIEDVSLEFEDFHYRTPMKFGGNVVDRVTLLNVHCTIRAGDGRTSRGFGSMTLGNVWSFPQLPYDTSLHAMKALAGRIAAITRNAGVAGHPIDINIALEPEYLKAAAEVSRDLKLSLPIPKLCTLVTFSPFDAAVHDAYGKLHGVSCYETYGPQFLPRDLSAYLNHEFRGEFLDRYICASPRPKCRSIIWSARWIRSQRATSAKEWETAFPKTLRNGSATTA